MNTFPPVILQETLGAKLRRQLLRADQLNPWALAIMASPPTMTLGASGAGSLITNPIAIAVGNAAFVYLGTRSDNLINGYVTPSTTSYSGSTRGGGRMGVAIWTDAQDLEINFQTAGSPGTYRILVNGQYAMAAGRTTGATGGQNFRDRITFASSADRLIEIEMDANVRFGGITIGANDSVWAPNFPPETLFVFSDSFGEPTGNSIVAGGWADLWGRSLGYQRRWISGAGATGLVANSGGTRYTFVQRLIDIGLCTDVPTHVHVQGSINDNGNTATVPAAAAAMFSGIRSQLPNAIISASGAPSLSGVNANDTTNKTAIQTALAAISGPTFFIDNIADTWFANTSSVTRYKWSDGVHPGAAGASGEAGHQYLADRHMPYTRAAYNARL